MTDIFILGGARTPMTEYVGALKDVSAIDLGVVAARGAFQKTEVKPEWVDHVVFGNVLQTSADAIYGARHVALKAGVPIEVPALTVNRLCGSGIQAAVTGAHQILAGDADIVLAGGIENMSRVPYLVDAADARWGHKMGHFQFVDAMYRDGFGDPLSGMIMGETAEVLARQYGITREQSDAFALESQRKAEAAQKAGYFAREIVPVTITERGKATEITTDEHPRHGSTIEALRKLPLTFPKVEGHDGIITAGSASGITDGAAALVLASGDFARARGLQPLARIVGWASAGVDPRIMGIGPVPAIAKLKARIGWGVEDFDLVEINEAFAPQVLAVLKDVPIPAEKLNVNGGAIALGHPIGCSGARIVVTLLHELLRQGKTRGLATLCVSGGMGMALAIEVPSA